MAANAMSVRVIYETGSQEVITAPDLSIQEGFAFEGEVVDVSDPDRGIWWYRNFIPLRDVGDADEGGDTTDEGDPWREFQQGTCVVPATAMSHVVMVLVGGVRTLVRDPEAETECGLLNVLTATDDDQEGPEEGAQGPGNAVAAALKSIVDALPQDVTDEGDIFEDPDVD